MNDDEIIDLVKSAITPFYGKITNVDHHRYKSWEYCYQNFIEARNRELNRSDIDALSLHLAFYLASWGMYRGSSFLLHSSRRCSSDFSYYGELSVPQKYMRSADQRTE